jgi:HPt (histidine-containing phosphotransfer) domain-containing protein
MDGYLSKPIDVDELIATLEEFGGGTRRSIEALPAPTRAMGIFDEQAALSYTGGDRRLLMRTIAMFRSDCAAVLRRIKRAVTEQDGEALRMAAHALKGSIATVGAPAGREAAAALEQMGRANRFDDADGAYSRLKEQIALLNKAFAAAGLTRARRTTKSGRRTSKPKSRKKRR